VAHKRLIAKLEYYGITGPTGKWIEAWLTGRTQSVILDGESSAKASVKSGVPQGTVLGPLMFLLYINDIAECVSTSKIKLFADDCLLYRNVNSPADADLLQADLTKLQKWSEQWQLQFNAKKCYNLNVHKKTSTLKQTYILNGHTLDNVNSQTYLGIELQSNLKWHNHVNKITAKANQMLAFTRRNLYMCPRHIKVAAYQTLVRPHLEYASAAWDPYHKVDIHQIEMVQHRAARFVVNNYSKEPGSMTSILNDLGWSTLEERRRQHRIHLLDQTLKQSVAIEIPGSVNNNTRQSRRSQTFTQISTNHDFYKFSFWPRTIVDYNTSRTTLHIGIDQ
jgi:hypothetical protein